MESTLYMQPSERTVYDVILPYLGLPQRVAPPGNCTEHYAHMQGTIVSSTTWQLHWKPLSTPLVEALQWFSPCSFHVLTVFEHPAKFCKHLNKPVTVAVNRWTFSTQLLLCFGSSFIARVPSADTRVKESWILGSPGCWTAHHISTHVSVVPSQQWYLTQQAVLQSFRLFFFL